jgi:hypothetical protein
MNTFYEHHKESIWFQFACFDRILLNGMIPLLLPPPVSTILLHVIAGHRRACQACFTGVQTAPNKIDVIVGEGERLPGHL